MPKAAVYYSKPRYVVQIWLTSCWTWIHQSSSRWWCPEPYHTQNTKWKCVYLQKWSMGRRFLISSLVLHRQSSIISHFVRQAWSSLGPTQNPFSNPPLSLFVCFVPRLSEQSFVTQFRLFFDHQKKKERKKEVVPIPIPPFANFAVLILIETKHNTNNDTLSNFAVLILIKPKTQYEQWHGAMSVLQKLMSLQTCRFFGLWIFDWLGSVLSQKGHLDTRALRASPPTSPYVLACMSECLLHPK